MCLSYFKANKRFREIRLGRGKMFRIQYYTKPPCYFTKDQFKRKITHAYRNSRWLSKLNERP